MTLLQIIDTLKAIALTQHNIRTATDGDIYEALNGNLSVKYGAFHVNQTSHQTTENTDVYGLNLFFVDRLEDDDSNRLQIQSIGKTVLDNIVRAFCEQFDADIPTITYTPFTQRFTDMTAGVFATVTLTVFKEWSCAEGENFITPLTINNQEKAVYIEKNGAYRVKPDEDYSGLGEVEITVAVPDENGSYDVGYGEGYDAGHTEGYGTGFAVGYEKGEDDGYQKGVDEGVAGLPTLDITENGVYDQPNKGVNVNVTPKINVIDADVKFGYSNFSTLPDYFYFPDVIRVEGNMLNAKKIISMFSYCSNLTDISFLENVREYTEIVAYDSSAANMSSMFFYCTSLKDITPLHNLRVNADHTDGKEMMILFDGMFDATIVEDFTPIEHMLDNIGDNVVIRVNSGAFGSKGLTRFDLNWPWSRVIDYSGMLNYNAKIEYICELDASGIKPTYYNPLNVLNVFSSYPYLTYFGGFRNQKLSIDNTYFLSNFPNLTRESCLAIVNNLYDFTGNGEVPKSNEGVLRVHANFITALGDDLSIATNKGWTVRT